MNGNLQQAKRLVKIKSVDFKQQMQPPVWKQLRSLSVQCCNVRFPAVIGPRMGIPLGSPQRDNDSPITEDGHWSNYPVIEQVVILDRQGLAQICDEFCWKYLLERALCMVRRKFHHASRHFLSGGRHMHQNLRGSLHRNAEKPSLYMLYIGTNNFTVITWSNVGLGFCCCGWQATCVLWETLFVSNVNRHNMCNLRPRRHSDCFPHTQAFLTTSILLATLLIGQSVALVHGIITGTWWKPTSLIELFHRHWKLLQPVDWWSWYQGYSSHLRFFPDAEQWIITTWKVCQNGRGVLAHSNPNWSCTSYEFNPHVDV